MLKRSVFSHLIGSLFGVLMSVSLMSENGNHLLEKPIASVVFEKCTVGDIAGRVATAPLVPVGFEGIPDASQRTITVSVSGTNLKGLLDAIMRAAPEYKWALEDGAIVDILPDKQGDRFLDKVVPKFEVHDKSRSQALQELTNTPTFKMILLELRANLRTLVSGPPNPDANGPRINMDLRNVPVREILNKIVTLSQGHEWSAVRYGDHLQYLSLSVGG